MKFTEKYPEAEGLRAADILDGSYRERGENHFIKVSTNPAVWIRGDCAEEIAREYLPCRKCGAPTLFLIKRWSVHTDSNFIYRRFPFQDDACSTECVRALRQTPDAFVQIYGKQIIGSRASGE